MTTQSNDTKPTYIEREFLPSDTVLEATVTHQDLISDVDLSSLIIKRPVTQEEFNKHHWTPSETHLKIMENMPKDSFEEHGRFHLLDRLETLRNKVKSNNRHTEVISRSVSRRKGGTIEIPLRTSFDIPTLLNGTISNDQIHLTFRAKDNILPLIKVNFKILVYSNADPIPESTLRHFKYLTTIYISQKHYWHIFWVRIHCDQIDIEAQEALENNSTKTSHRTDPPCPPSTKS